LVDSCKRVAEKEAVPSEKQQLQEQPSQRSSVIVRNQNLSKYIQKSVSEISVPLFSSLDQSLDWCTKDNLEKKYADISDKVLLDPQGEYMMKLLEVDKNIVEQARANKMKIVMSNDYISIGKSITETIGIEFLRNILPGFLEQSIRDISSSTAVTLLGLLAGMDHCLCSESMLDQIQLYFSCTSDFLKFWKDIVPDIDELKALPLHAFAIFTSPWAPKIEDEDFVAETFQQLDDLLRGDQDLSRLLLLLSLFSPVGIEHRAEEKAWLKKFQNKISMMVYSHVMGQENMQMGNKQALEIVKRMERIIVDLYKCGQIFHQGLIHYDQEEKIEDIETIEIAKLL